MTTRPTKTMKLFAAATAAALFSFSASATPILSSELGILDLDANGGINPATGAAWAYGDTYRLAFVTEGTTLATSTDIATYNAFVTSEALASTTFPLLGTSWNAIASTATVDARDNTNTNPNTDGTGESVFLLNGSTVVAEDYTDLWDGRAENRINRTQNNISRQGNFPNTPIWGSWTAVWTGGGGDGTANSPLGGVSVRHGLMQAESNFWMSRSTNDPSVNSLPMYALSDVLTVVPEPGSLALLGMGALLIARRRRA